MHPRVSLPLSYGRLGMLLGTTESDCIRLPHGCVRLTLPAMLSVNVRIVRLARTGAGHWAVRVANSEETSESRGCSRGA